MTLRKSIDGVRARPAGEMRNVSTHSLLNLRHACTADYQCPGDLRDRHGSLAAQTETHANDLPLEFRQFQECPVQNAWRDVLHRGRAKACPPAKREKAKVTVQEQAELPCKGKPLR